MGTIIIRIRSCNRSEPSLRKARNLWTVTFGNACIRFCRHMFQAIILSQAEALPNVMKMKRWHLWSEISITFSNMLCTCRQTYSLVVHMYICFVSLLQQLVREVECMGMTDRLRLEKNNAIVANAFMQQRRLQPWRCDWNRKKQPMQSQLHLNVDKIYSNQLTLQIKSSPHNCL